MSVIFTELIIICLLFTANGLFAMAELAVVSARRVRLKHLAASGSRSAAIAMQLAEDPNRFLPAVQTGITLVGLLAGAFGGITIAEQIAAALQKFPTAAPYAEAIGVGCVVVGLTFISLVIGELVPKRLALAHPERIACLVARPVDWLSRVTRPLIRLLGWATNAVLWLLRVRERPAQAVTNEEVKLMMQEGVEAGVFDHAEPSMVESVLAFDSRPVRDIATPREKLVFLNQHDSHEDVWHKIVVSGHSNFPVCEGTRDRIAGIVSVKAAYANLAAGLPVHLLDLMTRPLVVPETLSVSALLAQFRETGKHLAVLENETRHHTGLVTLVDVLEAIVGEIPSREERLKPEAVRRGDGSYLVDGGFPLAQLAALTGQRDFAEMNEPLAAFVARDLGAGLREGATLPWGTWRAEVIDMDGRRVDKVLLTPARTEGSAADTNQS